MKLKCGGFSVDFYSRKPPLFITIKIERLLRQVWKLNAEMQQRTNVDTVAFVRVKQIFNVLGTRALCK